MTRKKYLKWKKKKGSRFAKHFGTNSNSRSLGVLTLWEFVRLIWMILFAHERIKADTEMSSASRRRRVKNPIKI